MLLSDTWMATQPISNRKSRKTDPIKEKKKNLYKPTQKKQRCMNYLSIQNNSQKDSQQAREINDWIK